ncbi:MAG: repeat containing protein, partial [Acidobacteria bacterium]|nr:repeat containing protein [Acidobacteriota bacterium]
MIFAEPVRPFATTHSLLADLFLLVTGHSSLVTVLSAQGIITTVAGNGRVLRGDGGPAAAAVLGDVGGVAVDSSGNVYASDRRNDMVVKIAPSGVLRVVAGNGLQGFSGDGGPATSASLNSPRRLTVDAAGNLYIADAQNNRIRRVSPDGIINTVVGNGNGGFSGDGGPALSASLSVPRSVAVDAAGNLYIADGDNHRIRRVTPGGVITTVAGNGAAAFAGDGGPATSASFNLPNDVAVDAAGNLYVADVNNHRIRRVTPGGVITTVAGNGAAAFAGDGGPATNASLSFPQGVALD